MVVKGKGEGGKLNKASLNWGKTSSFVHILGLHLWMHTLIIDRDPTEIIKCPSPPLLFIWLIDISELYCNYNELISLTTQHAGQLYNGTRPFLAVKH